VSDLNEIIHQPVRLRIMAALVVLDAREQLDFPSLAKVLKVTDGNLGAHLMKLEEAGYIRVEKTFVDRKPRTYVNATTKGKLAFETHVAALRKILDDSGCAG
jgi:DNA-binding MarR family transcriptional regulator